MSRVVWLLLLCACSDPRGMATDAGAGADTSFVDGSGDILRTIDGGGSVFVDAWRNDASFDGGAADGNVADGATGDGGIGDGGARDGGARDGGARDDGVSDSGLGDSGLGDSGTPDSGAFDAGGPDAGRDSGASGGCISGATGTHAVRFTWNGNGAGSTAYVSHDLNELPDTSLWRVSAASSNISYRPVFTDVFLGEGGLDLGGTVFIDIQLSTLGLSAIDGITLSVYGRSFNTTTSGSFTWQSFEGTGASPRGGVSNSAPYEWYSADATGAIAAGDDGVRLRLRAGPPSSSLVVRQVEVCFRAR